MKPPWFHGDEGPLLQPVKVSELWPGRYCEIDMMVPPNASEDSFHCLKGTVQEVNHDEVILTDVIEARREEFATTSHQRPPTQKKRDVVHVPLTGVDTIWALPPGKDEASAKPPTVNLPPSQGSAVPTSPTAPPFTAGEAGSRSDVSHPSATPLPADPAHFELPPPVVGGTAR